MRKDDVNWAFIILMFLLGWILHPYIAPLFNLLRIKLGF
jgi:hypothetical protein